MQAHGLATTTRTLGIGDAHHGDFAQYFLSRHVGPGGTQSQSSSSSAAIAGKAGRADGGRGVEDDETRIVDYRTERRWTVGVGRIE